jgi:hypothetical protein
MYLEHIGAQTLILVVIFALAALFVDWLGL